MTRILAVITQILAVITRILFPVVGAGAIGRLRVLGVLAAALLCAAAAGAAVAQPPPPAAQLSGTFQMSGTVTVAYLISGEYVGEPVQRTWKFTPLCATAPCATVRLARTRATGTDRLTLTAISPTAYAGTGRFFAPLRCAGRIHRPGEVIPFKITVRVTATAPAPDGGPPTVTAISASYVNRSRQNLTHCLALLGHDSASYAGQLVTG